MKALFLSPSLSYRAGGIFEITRSLAHSLIQQDVNVEILGLYDDGWPKSKAKWHPAAAGVFPIKGPATFGFSPSLQRSAHASDADILHLHALWMFTSIVALSWSQRKSKPYVVTPNGMLEPWALRNSAWKKRLASCLYDRRMLSNAFCLQANCTKELKDFRDYGLSNPVAVIPNGVGLPTATRGMRHATQRTLLFLGRLHPKKGLVNALQAWVKNGKWTQENWRLVIAGWDQGGHEVELKRLCDELGIRWGEDKECSAFSVVFAGPVFGKAKESLLRQTDAFILPSFSEGLPMAVLEAWAHGLPVLMTDQCNLPEGFAAGAAIRIGTDSESIAAGLSSIFSATDSALRSMGEAGRVLVAERFTWPKVAAQMKSVYEWILGGGPKPDCVLE